MHVYPSIAQISGHTGKQINQVATVMPVSPYILVLLGNCQAVIMLRKNPMHTPGRVKEQEKR
jgi:hypothetical protein